MIGFLCGLAISVSGADFEQNRWIVQVLCGIAALPVTIGSSAGC